MWGVIVAIIILVIGFAFYSALGDSGTTFRVVTNLWIANKELDYISDEGTLSYQKILLISM